MTLTLNGTSGVTTPGIANSEGYTGDGLTIAAGAPAGAVTINSTYQTFSPNGSEAMRLDAFGNLLVGNPSAILVRLYAKGETSDSSRSAFALDNAAGAPLLRIRNDGVVFTGGATFSPYNNTTGSAANMFVGAAGDLYRSTSSIKYKKNVQDAVHCLTNLLTLRAVTYEGNSKADEGKIFGGLIAEEVHDAGLTEFVQYAEDGTPDALAYGNMVSLCVKAIQEQQAIITELKARIEQLENK